MRRRSANDFGEPWEDYLPTQIAVALANYGQSIATAHQLVMCTKQNKKETVLDALCNRKKK